MGLNSLKHHVSYIFCMLSVLVIPDLYDITPMGHVEHELFLRIQSGFEKAPETNFKNF